VNSVEIGCIGLGNGIAWGLNFLRKESNRTMCEDSKDGFVYDSLTTQKKLEKCVYWITFGPIESGTKVDNVYI
jgi:hypothetical protein